MAGLERDVAGQPRDTAGPEIPLADAAAILGVTQEAVRKRLRRGSLIGGKRRGEWWVRLPLDEAGHGEPRRDTRAGPGGTERDAERDMAGRLTLAEVRLAEVERQRAQLEGQVDFLQRELERAAEAQAELRRLLAMALQTRALPAPRAEVHADVKPHAAGQAPAPAPPAPWWKRFWRW